jgi:glycosyltransferase involved in cell wall biosynthesis
MRVLHLGKFYPPHPGGIERSSTELMRELARHGVANALLAHAEPGTCRTRVTRAGSGPVVLAACFGRWLYAPLSPSFPGLLRVLLRRFRPDLLHLHLPNPSAFSTLLVPRARRVPWIVHWHADVPIDSARAALRLAYRAYRPLEQALLGRARAIIATSPNYRDTSAALAPWLDKTRVIPLGIPPAPAPGRSPPPWPTPGVRLLAVGRASYFKGFDILLRALVEVPQASLLLVGDGELLPALRAEAHALGLAARVRFRGRIDLDEAGKAELAAIYRQAEIFCLPSIERAESFGLVLLEAMQAGLPVIASAIPGSGIGFVVRDGETGLLVPPADVTALANAIRLLAADADLRRRLGAAGQARWRDEFTLARCASRVLALYQELLPAR